MKQQKTYATKKKDIVRKWYLVNADEQVLGRLASAVAQLLMGKQKPNYVPYLDGGDHVVVIHAEKFAVTGTKETSKKYYRYSGYPSGLRVETLSTLKVKKPAEAIRLAVKGMLPKNRLQALRLKRLHLVVGSAHMYQKQNLEEVRMEQKNG